MPAPTSTTQPVPRKQLARGILRVAVKIAVSAARSQLRHYLADFVSSHWEAISAALPCLQ